VRARYVVGCDGAHSTVRTQAGIAFEGHAYPQTFLLADLEVDGLEPGAAHTYLTAAGMLFFFPLGTPATWRMIAMRPPGTSGDEVTLDLLQQITDDWTTDHTDRRLILRDPVWMTAFRIHNRGATHYRKGPFFLAGDAAHIHSPAGGQGMNTGIQDALNLGWKLAHVCRGAAPEELLQTYEAERAPVGHGVRRLTDRAFTLGTSSNPALRLARTHLAPRLARCCCARPAPVHGSSVRSPNSASTTAAAPSPPPDRTGRDRARRRGTGSPMSHPDSRSTPPHRATTSCSPALPTSGHRRRSPADGTTWSACTIWARTAPGRPSPTPSYDPTDTWATWHAAPT
jgi:hypothetical protein